MQAAGIQCNLPRLMLMTMSYNVIVAEVGSS